MKEAINRRRRGTMLRRDPDSAPIPRKTRKWGLAVSIGLVLLGTAIVVNSLYDIQIRNGEMYSRYASDQQLLDTTIQATRGEIYDATGKVLASTSVVWDIWCDPSYSTALYDSQTITSTDPATGGEVESTVRTLGRRRSARLCRELTLRLLSGDGVSLDKVDTTSQAYAQQYEAIYAALSKIDSSYQVLAEKVNNAVKESIEQYVSDRNAIKGSGRLSLSSSRTYQRNYPYGAFAASVLGFTNADGEGFYGLEKSYDDILSGTDGRTVTIRNARGNAIADGGAVTYDAKDGDSLVLTLDTTIQEVVEKYLNEAIAANTVENRGCAIVMDVNTGGILAMASKPDFDPNNPNDYTPIQAYLEELVRAEPELYGIYLKNEDGTFVTDENGDKILDPDADYSGYFRDIMWKNKTITELYYPGSVFKVITAAMGVDSGNATYNTTFNCSGAYAVAKETYHCAGRHSHGTQNLADALLNSCNIYFIQLGQRIGVQTFYDYFKGLWLYRAHRRGPAQRDQLHAVLHRPEHGRGGAGLLRFWPVHGGDPPAGVHGGGGVGQRRLSGHPPMWWTRSWTPTATWWSRSGRASAARSSAAAPARPSARSWSTRWATAPPAAAATAPMWRATASAASRALPSC